MYPSLGQDPGHIRTHFYLCMCFKNYELEASSSSSSGLGGHMEVSWPIVVSVGLGVLDASSSSSWGLGGHMEVFWPRVDMVAHMGYFT